MRNHRFVAAVVLVTGLLAGCAELADRPLPSPVAPRQAISLPTPEPRHVANRQRTQPLTSTVELVPTKPPAPAFSESFIYGRSFAGRPLVAYRLGHGPIARALVGGIHGGYEWNTTALMSKTLDYLAASPHLIPSDLALYIIPLANPDGAAAGSDRETGRMNGNGVDLNRNWGYHWQMTATHGTRPVFAGAYSFSEPETVALRNFIMGHDIQGVIFYHSAKAEVYSGAGITTSKTVALAQFMAAQTGYRYAPEGMPGQITTGNAIDWLTVNGITAVEIELATHEDIDWESNRKGILAFLTWGLSNTHGQIE